MGEEESKKVFPMDMIGKGLQKGGKCLLKGGWNLDGRDEKGISGRWYSISKGKEMESTSQFHRADQMFSGDCSCHRFIK